MVVDTAGNVTANTINAVLLLRPKGKGGGETGLLRQVFAEPKAVHALSVEYTKISTAIRTKESF